jgi:hypothetical protein
MTDVLMALGIFIAIIVLLMGLRAKIGEKFEIRNSDILMALIPVAIWLVLTGKVTIVEFGGFKIEAAFREASQASVAPQITPVKLPVEPLTMDPKRGVEQIPALIENKTKALVFRLGYIGYYGPAIEEYLQRLTAFPYLKYIVIQNPDGTFVGLADARELWAMFAGRLRYTADDFARWIIESNTTALSQLLGYVSSQHAINENLEIQKALEQLYTLQRETLPVVDNNGKFVGMVEQSQLVSSMLLDVAKRIR